MKKKKFYVGFEHYLGSNKSKTLYFYLLKSIYNFIFTVFSSYFKLVPKQPKHARHKL